MTPPPRPKSLSVHLLALLGWVTVLVGSILLSGFTLRTMWGWFVMGTFGLPALPMATAIGLSAMVSFFIAPHFINVEKKKPTEVAAVLLYPLGTLIFGFIVTLFM